MEKIFNAWLALDSIDSNSIVLARYSSKLNAAQDRHQGISLNDWVILQSSEATITRVGRICRIRSDLTTTTLYFDRLLFPTLPVEQRRTSLTPPAAGSLSQIQWDEFLKILKDTLKTTPEEIAPLGSTKDPHELAYVRELLQLAIMDDLLGPAGGPHEHIIDMSVRDRYLVGKLAPRDGGIFEAPEGIGPVETELPQAELEPGQHEPGAELPRATGRADVDEDAAAEIDNSANHSLVPSSMGMTFCVAGDVRELEIEARWGSYERIPNDDHDHLRHDGKKARVWKRSPRAGTITLKLEEGRITPVAPDPQKPDVYLQGTIRPLNQNGDRLITLFLVNAQPEAETNRDSAWLFQPEIITRATPATTSKAIFRRKPVFLANGSDPEREELEMLYRNRVEFAVGHGVSVHAEVSTDPGLATEVRTVVMPQHEVQVTETPGNDPADRPAMRELSEKGHLDMRHLATVEKPELLSILNALTEDYNAWLGEQQARVGGEVQGYDNEARNTLDRCELAMHRLRAGIQALETNDNALHAFRFANLAMADQRVHSLFSQSVRRGENKTFDAFDVPRNRSWRPFQIAFLLLSIPSLADPKHPDRSNHINSIADLLWFPTGGGKTEAYLGVAAFAMAIRRLQGNLGGLDASRGLTVIMRYTLRLLTLQQFQRATALICSMEMIRRSAFEKGKKALGAEPFTIGLWVGNKVTPGTTEASAEANRRSRGDEFNRSASASPLQLTTCPWCGSSIDAGRDVEVDKAQGMTITYCGDAKGRCAFSKAASSTLPRPGLPVMTVDEELYHRPPSMMIATVDKFAMMAWRGQVRTLFGKTTEECPRHGLLWPGADCTGNHTAHRGLPRTSVQRISPIRPPDLIIQDEFHLISGPLGTMVGLYETAVDELCTWDLDGTSVRPRIVASTATVRKAIPQTRNVFMRNVAVFPPSGLDIEDNFFSVQRPISSRPGRRYLGVCSPGSSRPAVLIRVYTAFLTAAQELFERFGGAADPFMTMVGYFNSLRELGGMKRLAEDDVQTRSFRVHMGLVERPALAQRNPDNIRELTSRVSNHEIPKHLDQLELPFKVEFDSEKGKFVCRWIKGEARAIDIVLATNMLSVGVDINRLGLMAVNGQPKSTAEYIQATSRVGRSFPGLVCTVMTWSRPRDLSHYETFEHYHATFYKHVEAQSVTPFSPRAMDRGLTGTMLSMMRLKYEGFSPNEGADQLTAPNQPEMSETIEIITGRAWSVSDSPSAKRHAESQLKSRADDWTKKASMGGRSLGYEKRGPNAGTTVALISPPGIEAWHTWTVPMSMREVEPGVRLIMNTHLSPDENPWTPPKSNGGGHVE